MEGPADMLALDAAYMTGLTYAMDNNLSVNSGKL